MSPEGQELCQRCGHDVDKHRHLRPGSDCSLCGCPKLRRTPAPIRVLRGLAARLRGSAGD